MVNYNLEWYDVIRCILDDIFMTAQTWCPLPGTPTLPPTIDCVHHIDGLPLWAESFKRPTVTYLLCPTNHTSKLYAISRIKRITYNYSSTMILTCPILGSVNVQEWLCHKQCSRVAYFVCIQQQNTDHINVNVYFNYLSGKNETVTVLLHHFLVSSL